MPFKKGKPKTGGRVKGKRNNVTYELKGLIDRLLPDEELERIWRSKLYWKDPQITLKTFEMALHYRFGKPMTIVAGPEEHPPIKIDISAIPKFRIPA